MSYTETHLQPQSPRVRLSGDPSAQSPKGSKAISIREIDADALFALPPLSLEFYLRPAPAVARDLLGKVLIANDGSSVVAVRIVEVEAYMGAKDPASHTFRGKTPRNGAMFELGGACYVYQSYGIHLCMNVVVGPEGLGEGVLLRAGEPLLGVHKMLERRKLSGDRLLDACRGPGRLTQALGITRAHNMTRYCSKQLRLVDAGLNVTSRAVVRSPRIGISLAQDKMLRFHERDSRWVS